jgi:hypothetical protein
MRFLVTVTSLIVPVLGATTPATAQLIPADSGQPVRVALRAGPLIEGILVRQTPERFVIRVAAGDTGAQAMFLLRDVESVALPIYVRSAGSAFQGLGLGILGGGIVGGVISAMSQRRCHVDGCELSIVAVPAFALLGGFMGLMAGSSHTTTEWTPIWPLRAATPP